MVRRPTRSALFTAALLAAAVAAAPAADPPAANPFDALVPPAEVRAALLRLDPAALADAAGKAAAAEQKLGRPRPEVTAAQLYEITIRVAGGRRAGPVLDRLAADERVTADPRLAALIAATKLAAAASRNADPEMVVALDQISPEQFALFRGYLMQIQDAKALGDREALDSLTDHVAGAQDLTAPQRKYLGRMVSTTVAALPAKPSAAALAAKEAREKAARQEAEVTAVVAEAPEESSAETPAKGGAEAPATGSLAARLGGDSAALVDEGFEGRVDLSKVGKAWGRGDATALADHAFRMAEEERVLGRPHRHVPAKVLFQASFGLAIANGDADTVARLEKGLTGTRAPDFDGREEFLTKLGASKGLVASSRKGRQPFLVSVENVTPESFRAFRGYLARIQVAAAQKDAGMLAGLTEGLDTAIELDDAQRAYLVRAAAEAPPPGPAAQDATTGVLRLLEGEARAVGLPAVNRKVLDFCRARVGKKVDNGECAMLAVRALEAAGARQFPPHGANADYVWGKLVKSADARPGDVIQFRDVVLKVTYPDGRWQSASYGHHTAVVSQVDGPNRFTILQQNVGPAGKTPDKKKIVQVGTLDLAHLKQGKVWVYRPVAR